MSDNFFLRLLKKVSSEPAGTTESYYCTLIESRIIGQARPRRLIKKVIQQGRKEYGPGDVLLSTSRSSDD